MNRTEGGPEPSVPTTAVIPSQQDSLTADLLGMDLGPPQLIQPVSQPAFGGVNLMGSGLDILVYLRMTGFFIIVVGQAHYRVFN